MLNLRCADGHGHYSPSPEDFVGHECLTAMTNPYRKDGQAAVVVDRCRALLKLTSPTVPGFRGD